MSLIFKFYMYNQTKQQENLAKTAIQNGVTMATLSHKYKMDHNMLPNKLGEPSKS